MGATKAPHGNEIEQSELRSVQLGILDCIQGYCERHSLRYWLAYGTLIGAVRHRGFIPWDDDIDIVMPREDYEKLLVSFDGGSDGRYRIVGPKSEKEYYLPFAKCMDTRTLLVEGGMGIGLGVNIDIFPLDDASDSLTEARRIRSLVWRQRRLIELKTVPIRTGRARYKNLVLWAGKIALAGVQTNDIACRMDAMAKAHADEGWSRWACNFVWGTYGEREIHDRSWYDESTELEFEGRFYKAPSAYDKILTCLYGDYMDLPPEEKRVTHHDYTAWWR